MKKSDQSIACRSIYGGSLQISMKMLDIFRNFCQYLLAFCIMNAQFTAKSVRDLHFDSQSLHILQIFQITSVSGSGDSEKV
jgi:hypothetical protein